MKYKYQANYTVIASGKSFQEVSPYVSYEDLIKELTAFIDKAEAKEITFVQFAFQPQPLPPGM